MTLKENVVILGPEIDSIVEQLLKEYHVPGLSIAIVENGNISSKGYGFASLPSTTATANTLFYAGSTTKAMVAAAAGKLMEDPKYIKTLKWSTPIKSIIGDDFEVEDSYATAQTTIEDALSHRSGMPRHDIAYGWAGPSQISTVKTMRHMPMTQAPRTTFQYCNVMYAAVGAALETLTARPTVQILKEQLWDPLQMKNTFFDLESATSHASKHPENTVARGYYHVDPEQMPSSATPDEKLSALAATYLPEPYVDISPVSAAGAVISSVNDYALWIRALLAAAKSEESPISTPLYKALTTPRTLVLPPMNPPSPSDPTAHASPALYALGWVTLPQNLPSPASSPGQNVILSHSGGLTGFGAQVYLLPGQDFGFVSFGNTALTSNAVGELVAYELMCRKLGLGEEERVEVLRQRRKELGQMLGKREKTEAKSDVDVEPSPEGTARPEKDQEKSSQPRHQYIKSTLAESLPLPAPKTAFEGSFHNPAYGTYAVTLVSPSSIAALHILRKSSSSASTPPSKQEAAVLVAPVLHHTWGVKFLLRHESGPFWSVETLRVHGGVAEAEGAANGWVVHSSDGVVGGAAAFVLAEDGMMGKLGLMILSEVDEKAERDGLGWERGMIWFQRVA